MKKNYAWICVVVAAALTLVGCKKEEAAETAPEEATKKVESAPAVDWEATKQTKEGPAATKEAPAAEPVPELEWPMSTMDKSVESATDFAKAEGGKISALWKELSGYQTAFLKNYSELFQADAIPPSDDVLSAFNELAYAVTGPTGFWRKTVANKWLGCANEPETPPCQKLKELTDELKTWDKVQSKIEKLNVGKSKRFLAKNHRRMMAYLKRYAPKEPSMSGMKETGLFKTQLGEVMETQ